MTPTLRRAPNSNDKHLWADYFELVCLLSSDGYLARGDIQDQADELNDVSLTDLQSAVPPDPTAAELADGRNLGVADLFAHLRYRASAFGDAYPFRIAQSARAFEIAPMTTDAQQQQQRRLYIFLLLASALEHLQPTERETVAAAFEGVAHDAIRAWLPPTAVVTHFGTNPGGRPAFEGSLPEKIAALATALSETASRDDGVYRDRNYGDGGLDVVAWFPFADRARASLPIFVQVTCQDRWLDKPGELRVDKWRQRLTLLTDPPSVLVIPYCFRSADGDWYLKGEISCTTLDRLRIVNLLSEGAVTGDQQAQALIDAFGRNALSA